MQNLSLLRSNSQPFPVGNHLSFNFHDLNKANLAIFQSTTRNKSYTSITSCVFGYIITTTELTNCERLYYLLADSLALIGKNKNSHRSCALSSEEWAKRLGCSRSLVFAMQQSLVKKGYFIINKDWDQIGRNKRNLITPTLPGATFDNLNEGSPDKVGDHLPYNPLAECKRGYLDRAKLFIKLNYDLLKIITSNKALNSKQKIMWLSFYTRCYKNYMIQNREDYNISRYSYNNGSDFAFIASYSELAKLYSCTTKHLSKSIITLEELGFIKTQHLYIRKKHSNNQSSCDEFIDNNSYPVQERQDQSLWKITLSLPSEYILELEKVKNRSNLKLDDNKTDISTDSNINSVENCLTVGGVKFELNLEQVSLLKAIIVDNDGSKSKSIDCNSNAAVVLPDRSDALSYIDSVMEELEENSTDNKEEKSNGIKSDPPFAKSGLLLNKALISKLDIKSNLGTTSKVLFNDFLKRYSKDGEDINLGSKEEERKVEPNREEFSIYSELIRNKLKELPRDKADKARRFAYALVSQKLAKGYAADLNKHELAKQLIHHAASWKPTKLRFVSRENEIDTALSVAWKKIVGGTWKVPFELAKAEILQYEFNAYRRKYQESGVLSHEITTLESDVNHLLGGWLNLTSKITQTDNIEQNRINENIERDNTAEVAAINYTNNKFDDELINQDHLQIDYSDMEQQAKHSIDISHISEEQKHLKLTPSDRKNDDSIKLDTIDGKVYFLKLKELEMNDQGELVMTLKPINKDIFLGLSSNRDNLIIDDLADNDLLN